MTFKILRKYNPEFGRCPNCSNVGTLKKYRASGFNDKLLKALYFRLYFCKECQWRGRFFTIRLGKFWFRSLLFYIAMIGLTIMVVYYYLSKFI